MSRFVLTAQLQLQAPTNVGQVVRQIQNQLNNVQVNVQVQGAAQAQRQLNNVTDATQQASNAAAQLGKNFGLSIKRFAAFTIATRAVSLFTSTLSKAVEESIAFERELIKISQVTGKSLGQLRDLTDEITRLSTTLGVSSTSLLSVSRILSQAGLNADETRIALDALAKSDLAPTFEDIGKTAEGVVAIFNQFEAGAEALEAQLGSINAVAGKFAVEAGDLISVIRRTGGVFKAAGGDLNELIALFTSVRATTRESAESIATGLRTIFTRIQRPKTIEFLRQYGVELLDLEGKFVGPFEATKRLSEALAGLEQGDITFIRIAEELGGFRQIGKVIPLLQQFRVAQEAYGVAQAGVNSLSEDAAKAQAALAVRITKVKEEFLALIRSITETTAFQLFANTALNLAEALIKLGEALKPVLPLLAAFAGFKLATGLGSFVRGIGSGIRTPRAFASGGIVPGTGNRDTVPAMLTPGEFVIRKSSVAKLGAGNLAAMNENRYAAGGIVHGGRNLYGIPPMGMTRATQSLTLDQAIATGRFSRSQLSSGYGKSAVDSAMGTAKNASLAKEKEKTSKRKASDSSLKRKYPGGLFRTIPGAIGGFFLTPEKGTDNPYTLSSPYPFDLNGQKAAIAPKSTISNFVPFRQDLKKNSILNNMMDTAAKRGIIAATKEASVKVNDFLDIKPILDFNDKPVRGAAAKLAKDKQVYSTLGGYLFEGVIQGITGASLAGGRGAFDFPNIVNAKAKLAAMFGTSESSLGPLLKADAKRSLNSNNNMSIVDKLRQDIQKGNTEGVQRLGIGGIIQKLAAGGVVNAGRNLYGDAQDPNLASPKQVAFIESLLSQFQNTVGARHPATDEWMPPDSKAAASSIISKLKATIPELPLIKQFLGKGINYGYGGQGSGFVVTKLPIVGRVQQRPLSQFNGNIAQIQEYIKRGELAFGSNAPSARGPSANSATSITRTRYGYGRRRYALGGLIKEFASGGNVGTDTVPALLTPGEFVVNRSSAQKIGYGNLNRMNKVGKYANGGVVQRFATGGQASRSGGGITGIGSVTEGFIGLSFALQALTPTIDESSTSFEKFTASTLNSFNQLASTLMVVSTALSAFGIQLNASTIMSGLKNLKNLAGTGKGGLGDVIGGFQNRTGFGGKVSTVRTKGESFTEAFNTASARSKRAKDLLASRASRKSSSFQLADSRDFLDTLKQETTDLNLRRAKPQSLTGKFGQRLSQTAGRGGLAGRAAGFAGRAVSGVGGLGGGAMTATIGSIVTKIGGMLGPLTLATTAVSLFSMAVDSFTTDYGAKLQEFTKAGDVANAERMASEKAGAEAVNSLATGAAATGAVLGSVIPGVGTALGAAIGGAVGGLLKLGSELPVVGPYIKSFGISIGTLFGGKNEKSITLMAGAAAASAKAQKSLQQASEKAASAMRDFESGTASASDVVKASISATKDAFELQKKTNAAIAANNENKSTVGRGAIARYAMATLTLGYIDSPEERNKKIDEENKALKDQSDQAKKAAIDQAMPGVKLLQREVAATGGDWNDFRDKLKSIDPNLAQMLLEDGAYDLNKQFQNLAKEAERTRKAFDAMNLGFQKVNAVSGALSVGLQNYLSAQEVGYSALDNTIRTLEASVTNAAQGISDEDFGAALGSASDGLRKLGASDNQIKKFEENLTAINTAQKFYAKASQEVKDELVSQFQRGAGSGQSAVQKRETFSNVIADQLKNAGIGDETRNRISDAIKGADIADEDLTKILEGDLSALDRVLKDLGENTLQQVIGPLQELAKYEQELANLTKKRLELENNVIRAQQGVLEAQLEAQEIIAKYGGQTITPDMRRQNIIQQANIQSQAAGISALGSGTGTEFNRRSQEIRFGLAQISSIRQGAASGDKVAQEKLAGESGVRLAEQEKRLQELAKADYDTTKKLIQQKENELKIIGEKNKAEKDAIDSLLAGDIEKFFEQQAAVGATAAIAAGNQTLMNAFGARAVGSAAQDIRRQQDAGVQSLYGQDLAGAGGLTERGFDAALSARGVNNAAMAQVAAGTTPEEEEARSEIIALAQTLPNYAETQLQTSQQDLATANIQYQAAQMQLDAAKQNVEQRAAGAGIAAMANGGVVYANRGIFVPRGTDTVPAMLTPGEFVVRRSAVQRGNNLQILQAMNKGQSGVSNIGGAAGMANGGVVNTQYLAFGGFAEAVGNLVNGDFVGKLSQSLTTFISGMNSAITKLQNTAFSVKLDNTNINVNLNGTSFLSGLKDSIKNELGQEIIYQMKQKLKVGDGGNLVDKNGV